MDDHQQADFWSRALGGRTTIRRFTPYELLFAAAEYFTWCNDNPLYSTDIRTAEGCVVTTPVAKMRVFTLRAMLLFIGLSQKAWAHYTTDPTYEDAVQTIKDIIYTQKYEGGASGLLNSTIIARDLGLSEAVDHKSSDGSMTPRSVVTIDATKLSDAAMAELLRATDENADED